MGTCVVFWEKQTAGRQIYTIFFVIQKLALELEN